MGKVESLLSAGSSTIEHMSKSGEIGVFQTMCLSAMDHASRQINGSRLASGQIEKISYLYEIGIQINDYYDTKRFDSGLYKRNRKSIPEPLCFKRYRTHVSILEKNRPKLLSGNVEKDIIDYRTKLNLVTTAAFWSIAFPDGNFDNLIESPKSDVHFWAMHNAIMALQVLDDWVGRQGDLENSRPTFYTAFHDRNDVYGEMRKYYDHYMSEARKSSREMIFPIALSISC